MMKHMMNRPRGPVKFLFFFLFGAVAVLAIGGLVMWLWNALLPVLFGVSAISFWQAIGILILSRILFGSFGKGGRRRGMGAHWKEKMMNMSEEEKAMFRAQWEKRSESGQV